MQWMPPPFVILSVSEFLEILSLVAYCFFYLASLATAGSLCVVWVCIQSLASFNPLQSQAAFPPPTLPPPPLLRTQANAAFNTAQTNFNNAMAAWTAWQNKVNTDLNNARNNFQAADTAFQNALTSANQAFANAQNGLTNAQNA